MGKYVIFCFYFIQISLIDRLFKQICKLKKIMFQMNKSHEQPYRWYKRPEVVGSDPIILD